MAERERKKRTALKDSRKKKEKSGNRHAEKILPPDQRPLLCPPDRGNRGVAFRVLGTVCRILIIATLVLGLTVFLCDALNLGQTAVQLQKPGSNLYTAQTQAQSGRLVFGCLAITVIVSLLWMGRYYTLIGAGCAGFYLLSAALTKDYFGFLYASGQTLYNSVLERLAANNYRRDLMESLMVGVRKNEAVYGDADYKTAGLLLLALVFALFLVPFLIRRVRLIPPAILCTGILVTVFTMNISRGTVGISLLIVAFSAVLVMYAYDRIFRKNNAHADRYDSEKTMFGEDDRPALSEELKKRVGQEQGKRKERAMYRADKKELDRQERAVRKYDRATRSSRVAMGGIAGFAMLILAGVVILFPAMALQEKLEIPWLSAKFQYARDFVTALLQGDEQTLDILDFESNKDVFKPHDTTAKKQEFDGTQIMYVQTRSNTPIYFRGWVATDYVDGAWYLKKQAETEGEEATDNVREFHTAFGADAFPDEQMKIRFFRFVYPSQTDILVNDGGKKTDYTGKVRSFEKFGFNALLVSVRRINLRSSLAYLPSYYDVAFTGKPEVLRYGTVQADDKRFVNYFDGIYTGRSFYKNQTADTPTTYAAVTFAPVMRRDWASELSKGIAAYNVQKEAIFLENEAGRNLDAEITVNGRTQTVTVRYQRGNDVIYTSTYSAMEQHGNAELSYVLLASDAYVLRLDATQIKQRKMDVYTTVYTLQGVNAVALQNVPFLDGEPESMYRMYNDSDEAQRRTAIREFETEVAYTDFVYRTYSRGAGSEIIREIADRIAENADFDCNLSAMRTSTNPGTYANRDRLVRGVIDYVIDPEKGLGCTYSLEMDRAGLADAALDGIENFLTVTKQGYCVQFASATALILREYGIPSRYVEGYIATDFKRANGSDPFTLYTYVRDYQAHAWVEVWFDGIGWVQYETTPYYYTDMYGSDSQTPGPNGGFTPPVTENTDTEAIETTSEVMTNEEGETLTPDEIASILEEESRREEERRMQRQMLIGAFAFLGGCGLVLAIVLFLRSVVSKAKKAEEHRRENAEIVLSDRFGENSGERERREFAVSMIDDVNELLRIYGITPEPGEFRDAYAKRIAFALPDVLGKPVEYPDFVFPQPENGKRVKPAVTDLPDSPIRVGEVLDAIAAEEFGHGMTIAQMKTVAQFYLLLREGVHRHIGLWQRFVLHYIKRKI